MDISVEKLKELLVKPGHISESDFAGAEEQAKKEEKNLPEVLIAKDLIKDEQIGLLIAEENGYRFINLLVEKPAEDVFNLIPELVARAKGLVAINRGKDGISVGMINPEDLEIRHALEKKLGEKIIPLYITKRGLESALLRYRSSLKVEFNKTLNRLQTGALSKEERDEIMVGMIDTILQYGYDNKASDIHIEPYKEKIVIRFRIDGVMHDVLEIPKKLIDLILARIKILSKMRTDEHRAAQDGKFQFRTQSGIGTDNTDNNRYNGKEKSVQSVVNPLNPRSEAAGEDVDVRVSVVPVTAGENVVMRLLSSKTRQFSLPTLGLTGKDFEKVESAIKKPHGMILVTGPTGSGKTTSIYAVMKILNKREVHISTIEDPVEYDIEGISQIQVNTKTELTFAKGLRAIVRQDPDIIMVGEIRDEETADIAVNSAMTGHLVLSTLHANDASTTLPRLLDMGVEPFLIASTVNIVIAQRLVRKVCIDCRASHTLTEEETQIIGREQGLKILFEKRGFGDLSKAVLYKGNGCKGCGDTGYQGRIGIFEILEITNKIKDLIIKRASSIEIVQAAIEDGMTIMLEDGVEKMFQGITTLEEVMRVTKT